jgi:large subunit ribosomal protein L4
MKINVVGKSSSLAQEFELNDQVYGLEPREDILFRVVSWQLAKRRAGTHSVKERGDVSGSTKKIVRQKGSGGARHGSKRGAQFRGGGIIFGPVVRDHTHKLPKKIRKLGMKMALSAKLKSGDLILIDNLEASSHKTKDGLEFVKNLNLNSVLLIDSSVNQNMLKSISNIHNIDLLPQIGANVYDIIRHEKLVLTLEAAKALEERLK